MWLRFRFRVIYQQRASPPAPSPLTRDWDCSFSSRPSLSSVWAWEQGSCSLVRTPRPPPDGTTRQHGGWSWRNAPPASSCSRFGRSLGAWSERQPGTHEPEVNDRKCAEILRFTVTSTCFQWGCSAKRNLRACVRVEVGIQGQPPSPVSCHIVEVLSTCCVKNYKKFY